MSKENCKGIVIPEGAIEQIIDAIDKISERTNNYEKEKELRKYNEFKPELSAVKAEFGRVLKKMESMDPADKDYYTVVRNLHEIKYVLDYWM